MTHSKTIVKDYTKQAYRDVDDESFSVRPLKGSRLIKPVDGFDDECEFQKNMFNFGDDEDLPDSDRAADRRCKNF